MTWRRVYSRPHDLQTDYFGRCLWFTVNRWHRLQHLEIVPDGKGQADHFVVTEEWDTLMKKLSREVFLPSQTIEKLKKKFVAYRTDLQRSAHALHNAQHLTSKMLYVAYREYMTRRVEYTYFFWLPWTINEYVESWFRQKLHQRFPRSWQELYETCSLPRQPNRMEVQQKELISLKHPQNSLLKAHSLKWGYLAVYTFNEPAWTWRDFLKQRNMLLSSGIVEHTFSSLQNNQKRFSRALRVLRKDPELFRIAKIISHFNYLRTERVDAWREVIWLIQPFFKEIERRFSLPQGTAPFLTGNEVLKLLTNGKAPPADRLRQRSRGKYLLRIVNGRIQVEENLHRIAVIKKRLFTIRKTAHIFGVSAYPGFVQGRVKIIKVLKDLRNFPKNTILVSPMTHPDYLLGIQQAAAVVTDEGGISCHAAIVARELKKPTIIGTKIATQVLKNGDVVLVDAVRGIVRKV